MEIMVCSFLWVMQGLYHQPQPTVLVWTFTAQGLLALPQLLVRDELNAASACRRPQLF